MQRRKRRIFLDADAPPASASASPPETINVSLAAPPAMPASPPSPQVSVLVADSDDSASDGDSASPPAAASPDTPTAVGITRDSGVNSAAAAATADESEWRSSMAAACTACGALTSHLDIT